MLPFNIRCLMLPLGTNSDNDNVLGYCQPEQWVLHYIDIVPSRRHHY